MFFFFCPPCSACIFVNSKYFINYRLFCFILIQLSYNYWVCHNWFAGGTTLCSSFFSAVVCHMSLFLSTQIVNFEVCMTAVLSFVVRYLKRKEQQSLAVFTSSCLSLCFWIEGTGCSCYIPLWPLEQLHWYFSSFVNLKRIHFKV